MKHFRNFAVCRAQPSALSAKDAIHQLGFVQADPIRSPARAQDLILRHRVAGYRAGDLDTEYPDSGLEEAFFYAYGFMPARTRELLAHASPRITAFEKRVLDAVRERGAPVLPAEVEEALAVRSRGRNAWGGQSKVTTMALERLQHCGHLRVARREKGNRLYTLAPPADALAPAPERLRQLILVVITVLQPAPAKTIASVASYLCRRAMLKADHRAVIRKLIATGEVAHDADTGYLWLAAHSPGDIPDAPRAVRFLAPFDPIVWDRRRFQHLWDWDYRFEAYTPASKRVRGYYAMPLLWGDHVIGWANATRTGEVDIGYVKGHPPRGRDYARELEAEISRLRAFLRLQ